MKYFLSIILIGAIVATCCGFYIKPENPTTGNFLIGISMVSIFFVCMPLFVYHRWKNKNVKDYMLTKENIEKMRNYGKDNDL